MAWVKSAYAGELAVISAWIAALTPWSMTLQPDAPLRSIVFVVRWPLLELQIRAASTVTIDGEPLAVGDAIAQVYPGTHLLGGAYLTHPIDAATFYGRETLELGSIAWAVGAVCVLVALALSIAMYRDEAGTREHLPYDEVRIMGVVLGAAAVGFGVATVLYFRASEALGYPIPIGVIVVGALATVLLRIERV